jgi:hypothetical protein
MPPVAAGAIVMPKSRLVRQRQIARLITTKERKNENAKSQAI